MICQSPESVPRPKGRGVTDRITVPCGKCLYCLKKRQSEWSFRLSQELRESISSIFVTLTYDDQNLPRNELGTPTLNKRDLQLHFKRLRVHLSRDHTLVSKMEKVSENALKVPKFRYYLCGEYGTKTKRPHYHVIMFNLPFNRKNPRDYRDLVALLGSTWKMGNVHIGNVTPKSINYTTKYITTVQQYPEGTERPFNLMSIGIGATYLDKNTNFHLDGKKFYSYLDGNKIKLPRYYTDRIFNDHERRLQAIKSRSAYDEEYTRENEKIAATGQNPFLYRNIAYQQEVERFNHKRSKKL